MAHVLAKELREAVLQAAITGGLSEHLYTDSSVKELLDSIAIEKTNLFKGKKDKYLTPINTDEYPFDIPEEWSFAKLGYISTYATSKNKINAKNANPDLWMLDLEDIEKGGRVLNKKRVSDSKAIGDKTCFDSGDILYSKLRPYLQKILIVDEKGICTPELIPFKLYGEINPNYILLFLKSPYVDTEINKVTYGVKMPRVGTETMVNLYVPIPPIEEQARIVAKVDEIMAKIDEYEKLENQLVKLKEQFPQDMKDSLLQAGMMGELTGCQPNSTESYSNVFEISGGSQPSKSYFIETPQKEYVRLYQTRDYGDKPIPVYIPKKFATKQTKEGDILLARYGGSLGKVFIAHDGAYNVAMVKVIPINPGAFLNKFIYYYHLSSAYQDFCRKASNGRSAQAGFNKDDIASISVNVFPIEEQQRIVDKLDELLPLVDKLAELN